jgi:hypothetical protein
MEGAGRHGRAKWVGTGAKLQLAIKGKIIRCGRYRGAQASQRSNGLKERARPESHKPSLSSDMAVGVIGRDAITTGGA